ncbi:hypothetical protein JL720_8254 [Aureococcus anophagefferens]|nr:hypothetical protein JL720_8254 [Aureococcus anophagefferens]
MKPHALLLAATAAARPVVWFDGAEDVPKRVRRSRAVSVGVAYRSDDDAPAAVCLHDTCGGGDDACVDVVGPAATSQLNHGFGHCAPGAHAHRLRRRLAVRRRRIRPPRPMVEAAVSQTAVTTNDTALITVAVAADGRGPGALHDEPRGDWLHHLHNFHCRPIPKTGETAFDVTVGFANCEPGQRSVSAIALPAGYLDAHPTTPITDLWRVAGPGAYDEVVFTVAWDDASAANLNQLYFAPGDAPGAYDAATAAHDGRPADLLGALFGAGADIDVLEFGSLCVCAECGGGDRRYADDCLSDGSLGGARAAPRGREAAPEVREVPGARFVRELCWCGSLWRRS